MATWVQNLFIRTSFEKALAQHLGHGLQALSHSIHLQELFSWAVELKFIIPVTL